ncbi:aminotransferase class V-fold PLP-dependent enzyme [Ruminococcus sp. XPD3002]|uniref:aminotransferase class V-fold PLP-dependent enzyme n=1 Tax=Ruminococcus sp. XPD3002 TaxID=1452269 RepID=UPI00090FE7A9|nr:cysteine desulfurase family protein [Ruminococcus flavefaciens]
MINFDNSATTFPKPESVIRAAREAMVRYGGNSGRGGHELAARTSEAVYSARAEAADFFGAEPENTVFTLNCTHALNMAIQGVMYGGGHMIISSLEHNSSARPAAELVRQGKASLSVAEVFPDDDRTIESFRRLISDDTKAVICTLASNVTGQLLPYRRIAELCRERGICFIADGAQVCGIIPVSLGDGINILCTSGHKGLYGLTGTGLLISDGSYPIHPIIQGGTGSSSESMIQPDLLPDSLESGTLNTTGIMSLKAGISFVKRTGTDYIFRHETELCEQFISMISDIADIVVYRDKSASYMPIVSFNIRGMPSGRTADILAKQGYCLRAGLHCSALAHAQLGTKEGTVRFSPSFFSRSEDVSRLASAIKNVTNMRNY